MAAKIVIVSGACGTGKSTVSRLLAENSHCQYTVHMHTDDFYGYIRKGYIDPWKDESGDQNEVVINAVTACAKQFLAGDYEVYVDGVIGPWFLEQWLKLADEGYDIRYIVLRPDEESTVFRAANREQREEFPLDEEAVRKMWHMFAELGEYEANAVDTANQTVSESAALIQKLLSEGKFRISK
ncbi:MAG: AAA family ATPase [Ruminococcus sp.]|nr:AAA family ATPase [Ruminococcus sp.]